MLGCAACASSAVSLTRSLSCTRADEGDKEGMAREEGGKIEKGTHPLPSPSPSPSPSPAAAAAAHTFTLSSVTPSPGAVPQRGAMLEGSNDGAERNSGPSGDTAPGFHGRSKGSTSSNPSEEGGLVVEGPSWIGLLWIESKGPSLLCTVLHPYAGGWFFSGV